MPEGASATIAKDGALTPPVLDDATRAFAEDVRAFVLNADRAALRRALAVTRRRDAITLVNLFRHASTEERFLIYDRLNELVPAPRSIPRESMAQWNIRTTESWWSSALEASGVRPIKKKRR